MACLFLLELVRWYWFVFVFLFVGGGGYLPLPPPFMVLPQEENSLATLP